MNEKNEKMVRMKNRIYRRLIGWLMALPGLYLLWLTYSNRAFDITIEQIIISITSMFISIIVSILFLFGIWIFFTGPED